MDIEQERKPSIRKRDHEQDEKNNEVNSYFRSNSVGNTQEKREGSIGKSKLLRKNDEHIAQLRHDRERRYKIFDLDEDIQHHNSMKTGFFKIPVSKTQAMNNWQINSSQKIVNVTSQRGQDSEKERNRSQESSSFQNPLLTNNHSVKDEIPIPRELQLNKLFSQKNSRPSNINNPIQFPLKERIDISSKPSALSFKTCIEKKIENSFDKFIKQNNFKDEFSVFSAKKATTTSTNAQPENKQKGDLTNVPHSNTNQKGENKMITHPLQSTLQV